MLLPIKINILSSIVFNVIQITDISINRDHHFRIDEIQLRLV